MDNRISDYAMPFGDRWPVEVSITEHHAAPPTVLPPGAREIYAAAWTKAQRDYELDRLFNASFYYEI